MNKAANSSHSRNAAYLRDLDLVLSVRKALAEDLGVSNTEDYTYCIKPGDIKRIAAKLGICRQAVSFSFRALGFTPSVMDPSYSDAAHESLSKDIDSYIATMQARGCGCSCNDMLRGSSYRVLVHAVGTKYKISKTTAMCWVSALIISKELEARRKQKQAATVIEHIKDMHAEQPNKDEAVLTVDTTADKAGAARMIHAIDPAQYPDPTTIEELADADLDVDGQEKEEDEEPEEEPSPSDNATVVTLIKSVEHVSTVLIIALTAFALLYLLIKGH